MQYRTTVGQQKQYPAYTTQVTLHAVADGLGEQVAILPCTLIDELLHFALFGNHTYCRREKYSSQGNRTIAVLSWFEHEDNLITMAWQVAMQRKAVRVTLIPLEVVEIQPEGDIPQVAEQI